tara:strand:- start:963 stop:1829 length:867 start_codon:yes stop_codon:yes gene_type:complete
MTILWMTSLRPIGKSKENDEIQDLFLNSIKSLNQDIILSLTQFDDNGVKKYIEKKKIKNFFINFPKKNLPSQSKYSNKVMLKNALDQLLDNNFEYFVYSTADLIVPSNLFREIKNIKKNIGDEKEFCALVYPNILKKNGKIKSYTTPHYGIDIFIFRIKKSKIIKFKEAIKSWDQYDWGINDNFYVSVCELLNLPIYNLYKKINIIKFENDFETINENRNWQIKCWKKNKKYFLNFLKSNNLPILYAKGSYYYLLLKILKLRDLNLKLIIVYIKFYLLAPVRILNKIF